MAKRVVFLFSLTFLRPPSWYVEVVGCETPVEVIHKCGPVDLLGVVRQAYFGLWAG